jgi:hypothetical protein
VGAGWNRAKVGHLSSPNYGGVSPGRTHQHALVITAAALWRQHMRRGDFEAAWRVSDRALWNRRRLARSSTNEESTWRGETLNGKRVLVRCYGLGDTFQFVRHVPLLRSTVRHVTMQAQASAARVLERVDGIDSLTTRYNNVSSESMTWRSS